MNTLHPVRDLTDLYIAHSKIVEACISLIRIQSVGFFIVVALGCDRNQDGNAKQRRVCENLQHC